jgi:hypothetical protein
MAEQSYGGFSDQFVVGAAQKGVHMIAGLKDTLKLGSDTVQQKQKNLD